jgi:serine protease Do
MSRRPSFLTAFLLCTALGWCAPRLNADPLAQPTASAPARARDVNLRMTPEVEVARRVRDSVVDIHSERTAMGTAVTEDLFVLAPTQHRINGMGTGIVIDPRGYVITNHHVVEDVNTIRVRISDGSMVPARVVARDREEDLALLKIEAGRPLPAIPLGTSSDLMVGEKVIAVGNSFGYDHTVSSGIISALGRDVNLNKEISYRALIQTTAAINPGNSGGPLLNVFGDLVGVNVAIRAGSQNIAFAIPVDTVIRVAASMLARQGGASLGLAVRDEVRTSRDEGFVRSVVVDRVEGQASKAGLQRGDVLLRVGETPVLSSLDLERGVLDASAGERVTLVYRRGSGGEQRAEMVLEGGRAPSLAGDTVWRRLGLRLQPIAAETVTRSNPQLHGGLLVSDVRPDSTAGRAGLQRGDILIGLHQWETLNVESVEWVLTRPELPTISPLKFFILRAGQIHRGALPVAD